MDKVRKKTPAETRLALIRAGIVTESGELTEHYKPKPKPRKSKKK